MKPTEKVRWFLSPVIRRRNGTPDWAPGGALSQSLESLQANDHRALLSSFPASRFRLTTCFLQMISGIMHLSSPCFIDAVASSRHSIC